MESLLRVLLFQSKEKMTKGSRRGCITLKKAIVGIDDEDNCTFTIHSEGHTYHFQGEGCGLIKGKS